MSRIIKTKSFEIAANITGDENANKVAILMPGRLDTKDYINFTKHAELLSGLGYLVAAIDVPGTWDSPGNIDEYCTSLYVQCINELIEFFGNRPTLLLGHSRGGASAMVVSSNPYVSGLILVNAAYEDPSPPDPAKLTNGRLPEKRDLPPGDKRTEEQVHFMLSHFYFEDGAKHNPAASLKNFKGPKLIVHATEDEFKPIDEVKSIFEKLEEPKMFLELQCAHDYRLFPEAINQVNDKIREFVKNED